MLSSVARKISALFPFNERIVCDKSFKRLLPKTPIVSPPLTLVGKIEYICVFGGWDKSFFEQETELNTRSAIALMPRENVVLINSLGTGCLKKQLSIMP
jgi:hypothetical protein